MRTRTLGWTLHIDAGRSTQNTFDRFKEKVDSVLYNISYYEEVVKQKVGLVEQFLKKQTNRDPSFESKLLKIHICKTTMGVAEKIVDIENKYSNKSERSRFVEELGSEIKRKELKGLYFSNNLFINLEMIQKIHKDQKEIEACLAATVVHEVLHHFAGFGEYKDRNMLWLDEVITEFISREIIFRETPDRMADIKCCSYEEDVYLFMRLRKEFGLKEIFNAYLTGNFHKIEKELESMVTQNEIAELLDIIDKISARDAGKQELSYWIDRAGKKKRDATIDLYTSSQSERKLSPLDNERAKRVLARLGRDRIFIGALEEYDEPLPSDPVKKDAKKALLEIDPSKVTGIQDAVEFVWDVIFRENFRYLGMIELRVPNAAILEDIKYAFKFSEDEEHSHACYVRETNTIFFKKGSFAEMNKYERALLTIHEVLHSMYYTNKRMDVQEKFDHTIAEAITNCLAGEIYDLILESNRPTNDGYENFRRLGRRIMDGIGKEKACVWYFGKFEPAALLFDRKYGTGSSALLKAADGYSDSPPTMIIPAIQTMDEISAGEKSKRMQIPQQQRFDRIEFGKRFARSPISAIYSEVQQKHQFNPYMQSVAVPTIAGLSKALREGKTKLIPDLYDEKQYTGLDTSDLSVMLLAEISQPPTSFELRRKLDELMYVYKLDLERRIFAEGYFFLEVPKNNQMVEDAIFLYHTRTGRVPSIEEVAKTLLAFAEKNHGVSIPAENLGPFLRTPLSEIELVLASSTEGKKFFTVVSAGDIMTDIRMEIISRSLNKIRMAEFSPMYPQRNSNFNGATIDAARGYFGDMADRLLVDQISGIYPIMGSLYFSAEMITNTESGKRSIEFVDEGIRTLQNYFIVPSDDAIRMLFEIAAMSQECVPRRGYYYSSLLEVNY